MTEIGEMKHGKEIGYKENHKYIWSKCEICGKERWVQERHISRGINHRCIKCNWIGLHHSIETKIKMSNDRKGKNAGIYNPTWKGGRVRSMGYIAVKIYKDNFFFPMADKAGYVMEHRLVMAQHLGRCLQTFELIHHKNRDKRDNRIENLELSDRGEHFAVYHTGYKRGYNQGLYDGNNEQIKKLKQRISELESQQVIKLLENSA